MPTRSLAARHLLVSLSGESTGLVDRQLAGRGLRRRVAMTVNQFHLALRVLARTDLVLAVASHAVQRLAGTDGFHLADLPLRAPATRLTLLWHRRLGGHPAFAWLRSVVAETCTVARSRSEPLSGRHLGCAVSPPGMMPNLDLPANVAVPSNLGLRPTVYRVLARQWSAM